MCFHGILGLVGHFLFFTSHPLMVCKKWRDFEICNLREMCFHDQKCPKAKSGCFGSQKSYGHKKWTLFFGNESIMLSGGFS
jgi:hypothetical protein